MSRVGKQKEMETILVLAWGWVWQNRMGVWEQGLRGKGFLLGEIKIFYSCLWWRIHNCEYTKSYWIAHIKWVNCMASELCPKTTVKNGSVTAILILSIWPINDSSYLQWRVQESFFPLIFTFFIKSSNWFSLYMILLRDKITLRRMILRARRFRTWFGTSWCPRCGELDHHVWKTTLSAL